MHQGKVPSIRVIDARQLSHADDIYEALIQHLQLATNGGLITPLMTVFAPQSETHQPIRIWNHQLIRYAAYTNPDGSILGDPMNLQITRIAIALGWSPPPQPSRFDILPLIIQTQNKLHLYPIPHTAVLEVPLRHHQYPWFEKLVLRWYALPILADLLFATHEQQFPCAPFNGWYMGTEIGARNLADENRYHQLPVIAEKLGLDTRRNLSLWKDHALLVLNQAVIQSFEQDGVRLVDHHQASREFIQFCDNEEREGRTAQADWSWIVPPISGAATPVFHRLYPQNTTLLNFLPQCPAWQSSTGQKLNPIP
jgi:nitric-oxide synthase